MYRLPTTDAINAYLDCVNFGEARIIRTLMRNWRSGCYRTDQYEHESHSIVRCLKDIDEIMGPLSSHGVEHCEFKLSDSTQWWAYYVNTGDTYKGTVMYLSEGHPRFASGFKLLCLGDLYE